MYGGLVFGSEVVDGVGSSRPSVLMQVVCSVSVGNQQPAG